MDASTFLVYTALLLFDAALLLVWLVYRLDRRRKEEMAAERRDALVNRISGRVGR
jgi:hypothetical protein